MANLNSMKTLAIIQARFNSTRLPGKVLALIAGEPMLAHVVRRVRRAATIDDVVVATSTGAADDAVAAFCAERGIACFRGSEQDVLDRFYQAASQRGAQTVVRITGDCPLMDPAVIDRVVSALRHDGYDYVTNTLRYTFPDGLDVEAFTSAALAEAWRDARKPTEREHVTPYLRIAARLRTRNIEHSIDLSSRNLRWTVDEPEDLEFVRAIYAELAPTPDFGLQDVLELLERRPQLLELQGGAVMNEGYYTSLYDEASARAAPALTLVESDAWFARAQRVIPGAAQTFSKGHTQYVRGTAPLFLARGKGSRVWDVDGNEYVDFVQGLLPNILGYAHDEVNAAASAQLARGHSFSLPSPIEVELAERLTQLIPCAEMVRFGKNGSDATAGAVRAARAFTGRERIACCGYHGWQDWFIGSTTRHAGVPAAVRELTHPFPYNDLVALDTLLTQHPGEFAAVIMEPVNFVEPQPGYLQGVQELARRHGALLIFDEICCGFHFGLGGAQKRYRVTPDLACFGKAMGNGFPIACVLGKREIMQTFDEIFFSFTLGGEAASMAAAMKVLDILEHTDALARMQAQGRRLQDGLRVLAKKAGLENRIVCTGDPVWSLLKFLDAEGAPSLLVRSLFQQEVIKRGVLILVTHNMSAAHDEAAVTHTLEAYAGAFKTLAGWLAEPDPARFLEGPPVQLVFRVR